MIAVERVVPPTAILLLLGKHDLRVVLIINRPLGLRKEGDTVHGIVVTIEIEVAGIREVGGMGNGTFASEVDPSIAEDESIEPDLEDLIGWPLIAPHPAGRVAGW
jgi:hypothetical protein